MYTLFLRLRSYLQSWGSDSRFTYRGTEKYPTKSGVLGLIANAMGMERSDDISKLSRLSVNVAILNAGYLDDDFCTIGGGKDDYKCLKASGDKGQTIVSIKTYICDADFLVGLESETSTLLKQIESSLKNPARPIFLGRKCCVPTLPVYVPVGIVDSCFEDSLRSVFKNIPFLCFNEKKIKLVVEVDSKDIDKTTKILRDCPLDFQKRKFVSRFVSEKYLNLENL